MFKALQHKPKENQEDKREKGQENIDVHHEKYQHEQFEDFTDQVW